MHTLGSRISLEALQQLLLSADRVPIYNNAELDLFNNVEFKNDLEHGKYILDLVFSTNTKSQGSKRKRGDHEMVLLPKRLRTEQFPTFLPPVEDSDRHGRS